jgi:hypothetical protein
MTGNTIYNIISKVESIVRGPVSEGKSLGTWAHSVVDTRHSVANNVVFNKVILLIKRFFIVKIGLGDL